MVLHVANATVNGSGPRPTCRRTVGGAAPAFRHRRERFGLSAPTTDPLPTLTGTHDRVRQAQVTRNNHVRTLLDMERNVIGGHVGSAIAKLIHIALCQQQAAWWLCHGRGKHSGELLVELAGRLCEAGRMDAGMLRTVVQEVHRLRHRVISGRSSLQKS
jgi:hypothetical protein